MSTDNILYSSFSLLLYFISTSTAFPRSFSFLHSFCFSLFLVFFFLFLLFISVFLYGPDMPILILVLRWPS